MEGQWLEEVKSVLLVLFTFTIIALIFIWPGASSTAGKLKRGADQREGADLG